MFDRAEKWSSMTQGRLALASLLTFALLNMSGCFIEAPAVKDPNRRVASFSHVGITGTCSSCHESQRPAPVNGVPHGSGQDCMSCHTPSGSWTTGVIGFSHTPVPASCNSCHDAKDRPAITRLPPLAASLQLAGHFGSQDCQSCHTTPSAGVAPFFFSHAGADGALQTSCKGCHEGERPTSSNGWVAYNPNLEFDLSTHGGSMDCATCHSSTRTFARAAHWAGGNFVHTASLTSCRSCHTASQWPTSTGPFVDAHGTTISTFDHATQATGDCAGCHQKALDNVAAATPIYSWANTGESFPRNLAADPGKNKAVTVAKITWSGTSITAVQLNQTVTLPQSMNHLSSMVSSSLLQNCAQCHANAASGDYTQGRYHPNVTPQPSACNDCHGAGTLSSTGLPTTGIPAGFNGANGAGRNPVSPEMNHGAMLWVFAGGNWSRSATPAYAQDCSVCHKAPGTQWSGARFHDNLQTINAQPLSCLDCHANNRPSGAVPASPVLATPTQFNHAGSLGDCKSCHAAPAVTTGATPPSVTLWANGVFHATAGAQTSCVSCHEANRPTGTSGWVGINSNAPFDYSTHGKNGSNSDCATCHKNTSSFTAMSGWSGGFFTHNATTTVTCAECHTSQKPMTVVAGFDHAASGTGDCAGCHRAALTNVIGQGANPAFSGWAGTGVGTPTGLVGSKTLSITEITLNSAATPVTAHAQVTSTSTSTVTLPLNIDHSSPQIPSIHFDTNGQLKCTDCHLNPAAGYKNGLFHTNPSTNSLWAAQPTGCKTCHTSILPTGVVGTSLKYLNHAALLSNGNSVSGSFECATCHTQPGVTGSWANGSFHGKLGALSPQSCAGCHYQEVASILGSVVNKMKHGSAFVTQDCGTCHAQPTPTQTATSGYPTANLWAGGKFHGKISTQPTSCAECHSGDRPAATTAYTATYTETNILNPKPSSPSKYTHETAYNGLADCAGCHVSSLPAATSWAGAQYDHKDSNGNFVTTCNNCHGAQIPTVTTSFFTINTDKSTRSPAGKATTVAYTHSSIYNGTQDCATCHTQVTGNMGTTFAGAYWTHTGTGATDCKTCHKYYSGHDSTTKQCTDCHNAGNCPNGAFLIPITAAAAGTGKFCKP